MKKLIVLAALFLAGCNTAQSVPVIVTEYKIIKPDDSFYSCQKPKLPKVEGLTDRQVSDLLYRYEQNIKICAKNLVDIKTFMNDNEKAIEEQQMRKKDLE